MAEKLCSSCGLCMIKEWPAGKNIQSCVFKNGWLGPQESDLFGRDRSLDDTDEMSFGICKERFAGNLKSPVPGAAWTGVITGIAKKAFESGLVEGVATLHRGSEDFFSPLPVLARSTETVQHYEFMQDFNVHMRHQDGSIEKLPYFCLPQEFTGINLVVPACMCCFDYMNSLADITVGYAVPFST